MKKIELASGQATLVDDDTYEWAKDSKWNSMSSGYAARLEYFGSRRTTVYLHRKIMNPPKGFCVDHIDGNKLNLGTAFVTASLS